MKNGRNKAGGRKGILYVVKRIMLTILAVFVILFVLLLIYMKVQDHRAEVRRAEYAAELASQPEKTEEDWAAELIDFEIADAEEDLIYTPYWDLRTETAGRGTVYIYDDEYMDLIFPDLSPVTKEDLYQAIEENQELNEQMKGLFQEYVDMTLKAYPNVDLRMLYNNLLTLTVTESDDELLYNSLSFSAYGCYVRTDNAIYVKENYVFQPQTWEYQVIMHEISHAARTTRREVGEADMQVNETDTAYNCIILNEALNSLYTVHMFPYEERDIAYQFQSNLVQVMIESMDNYDYADYMSHSNTWFLKMLDEWNGDHNYAWTMIRLMEVQYNDYHDDDYQLNQERFYPLYDYVADMYCRANLTEDSTEEEREAAAEELADLIGFDVPEEYALDLDYIRNYVMDYEAA